MHDKNGKPLKAGDSIYHALHGVCLIASIDNDYMMAEGKRGGFGYDQVTLIKEGVTKVRTWKELAQEAIHVQVASNLSGVVISFATIISEVRHRLESEGKGGTDNVNNHPICRLYSDKIAHLTGTQSLGNDRVSDAYRWAYDRAA